MWEKFGSWARSNLLCNRSQSRCGYKSYGAPFSKRGQCPCALETIEWEWKNQSHCHPRNSTRLRSCLETLQEWHTNCPHRSKHPDYLVASCSCISAEINWNQSLLTVNARPRRRSISDFFRSVWRRWKWHSCHFFIACTSSTPTRKWDLFVISIA